LSTLVKSTPGGNVFWKMDFFFSEISKSHIIHFILVYLQEVFNVLIFILGTEEEFGGLVSANLILLRNRLLDILLKLIYTSKEKTSINLQ
jgi:hypothetical protein